MELKERFTGIYRRLLNHWRDPELAGLPPPLSLTQGDKQAVETNGVSADDIVASIEMILGRTPDQELVDYHLKLGFANRFELGKYMLSTEEFRRKLAPAQRQTLFLGDRVLSYTHRGEIIYLAPTDVDLTPWIIMYGAWESEVEKTLFRVLRPGDIAVDVGANVGYHTLGIAAAVGTAGQVHAFEANPEVRRLLKATLYVNGLGRVTLHEHAIMDKPGTITLAMVPDHYGSGHAINEMPSTDFGPQYSTRVDVPATTLDSLLGHKVGKLDFLHMDIEGSEPLALYGAQNLIDQSPDIKILTEWSVGIMSTHADVGGFVAWLVDRGFRFWLIESNAELTQVEPSSALGLPHCNVLLARNEAF